MEKSKWSRHPPSSRTKAGLVGRAQTARGAAQFEPFVRLLLLFGRDQGLASIAALPDAGLGDELRPATAALFRHGFFQRKNPRFLRQQMGIVKIAMTHLLYLAFVDSVPRTANILKRT